MCLRNFTRSYISSIDGKCHTTSFPCGQCAECISDFRDMWSIRCLENTRKYEHLVYDTYTYRDDSLHRVDIVTDSGFVPSTPTDKKFLKKWGNYVPVCYKPHLQNFFKQGREEYFRATGKRLDCAYFCVSEICPTSNRPHYHVLFFFNGPSSTYSKYFGSLWSRKYGFIKTKYVPLVDASKVCFYITKYLLKDEYESELIKFGLLPKPFRLISKGFGLSFTDTVPFIEAANFVSKMAFYYPSLTRDKVFFEDFTRFARRFAFDFSTDIIGNVSPDDMAKLSFYWDSFGFRHSLPRYYKDKLLGNLPALRTALQNIKTLCSDKTYFDKFKAFASSKGFSLSDDAFYLPDCGLSPSDYNSLATAFMRSQMVKSTHHSERIRTLVNNRSVVSQIKSLKNA